MHFRCINGSEEDGGGDVYSVCIGAAEGLLDQLCPLFAVGRLGVGLRVFDDMCWCGGTPFISGVGVASCR